MNSAIFPGSFDPITLGHVDIINRALPLFDEIIIAIGVNHDKSYMFSLEQRIQFIKEHYKNEPKINLKPSAMLFLKVFKNALTPNIDLLIWSAIFENTSKLKLNGWSKYPI